MECVVCEGSGLLCSTLDDPCPLCEGRGKWTDHAEEREARSMCCENDWSLQGNGDATPETRSPQSSRPSITAPDLSPVSDGAPTPEDSLDLARQSDLHVLTRPILGKAARRASSWPRSTKECNQEAVLPLKHAPSLPSASSTQKLQDMPRRAETRILEELRERLNQCSDSVSRLEKASKAPGMDDCSSLCDELHKLAEDALQCAASRHVAGAMELYGEVNDTIELVGSLVAKGNRSSHLESLADTQASWALPDSLEEQSAPQITEVDCFAAMPVLQSISSVSQYVKRHTQEFSNYVKRSTWGGIMQFTGSLSSNGCYSEAAVSSAPRELSTYAAAYY